MAHEGEIWAVADKAITLGGATGTTDDAGEVQFDLGTAVSPRRARPLPHAGARRRPLRADRPAAPRRRGLGRTFAAPLLVGTPPPAEPDGWRTPDGRSGLRLGSGPARTPARTTPAPGLGRLRVRTAPAPTAPTAPVARVPATPGQATRTAPAAATPADGSDGSDGSGGSGRLRTIRAARTDTGGGDSGADGSGDGGSDGGSDDGSGGSGAGDRRLRRTRLRRRRLRSRTPATTPVPRTPVAEVAGRRLRPRRRRRDHLPGGRAVRDHLDQPDAGGRRRRDAGDDHRQRTADRTAACGSATPPPPPWSARRRPSWSSGPRRGSRAATTSTCSPRTADWTLADALTYVDGRRRRRRLRHR